MLDIGADGGVDGLELRLGRGLLRCLPDGVGAGGLAGWEAAGWLLAEVVPAWWTSTGSGGGQGAEGVGGGAGGRGFTSRAR